MVFSELETSLSCAHRVLTLEERPPIQAPPEENQDEQDEDP